MGRLVALPDALDLYYSFLAPSSDERYKAIWSRWLKFISPGELDAQPFDGLRYAKHLAGQDGIEPRQGGSLKFASTTQRQHILVLHGLYKFLGEHQVFQGTNPFTDASRRLPRAEAHQKRVTEAIDFDEVSWLLETCGTRGTTNIRDRAMLSALLGGALRLSEMLALRIRDVKAHGEGMTLHLRETKAGRPADQPVPSWAAQAIAALVLQRRREGAGAESPLFASYNRGGGLTHEGWTRNGAYRRFVHIARRAEVAGTITPHSCRATAISRLLAEGLDHKSVKDFSRHTSVQMVERYDKRTSEAGNCAKKLSYR